MKTISSLAIIALMMMVMAGNILAETNIETIQNVICDYYGSTPEVEVEPGSDHHYLVKGPGGEQRIAFSPELIESIRKLRSNSDAGQSLMTICPTQAALVRKAMRKKMSTVSQKNSKEPDCRICDKKSCSEKTYRGNVPNVVLSLYPEGADALELHDRCNKNLRFKAKRVRVSADGVAKPMIWEDGGCMTVKSEKLLTEVNLRSLLLPGESLKRIDNYPADSGGSHNTIAVYIIK